MMKQAGNSKHQEQLDYYHRIYSLLPRAQAPLLDHDQHVNSEQLTGLVDAFEDLMRPLRNMRFKREGRRRLIKYQDLHRDLTQQPIPFDDFKKSLDLAINLPRDQVKLAAAIFGVNV